MAGPACRSRVVIIFSAALAAFAAKLLKLGSVWRVLPVPLCVLFSFSAALAEVSGVTVSANAWDARNTASGCPPDGCVAENVLDENIEPESRWSCKASISQIEACELTFVFDEPQDIVEIRIAMFKGNERSRTVNIWADGVLSTTVTTSATTLELEAYELAAMQATTIVLQEAGGDSNDWFSVTEVGVY